MAQLVNRFEGHSSHDRELTELAPPRATVKIYYGEKKPSGSCEVWCEDRIPNPAPAGGVSNPERRPLPLCLEVRNHSPTGFEWGYGGSGPAQLALALLVDALGDAELAEAHDQDFKFSIIAGWGPSWTITSDQLRAFVAARTKS